MAVALAGVEGAPIGVWAGAESEPGWGSLGTPISRLGAIRVEALLLIRRLQRPQ